MATATPKKPTYSTKHGPLDVAVWKNTVDQNTYYNVSLTKSFKHGEEWGHTQTSFAQDDTLVAARLLKWAHDVIQEAYDTQEEFVESDKPFASKQHRTLEPLADILGVAVSQNMDDHKLRYRVELKRSYNHREQWKETVVELTPEDCLNAARLLTRAFDAIDSHVAGSGSSFAETAKQQSTA